MLAETISARGTLLYTTYPIFLEALLSERISPIMSEVVESVDSIAGLTYKVLFFYFIFYFSGLGLPRGADLVSLHLGNSQRYES